jgi:SAM-dependent methyltransferase
MATGTIQGRLWGKRARDYATYAEAAFLPLFETVLSETGVATGTRLLDVGCGTGLATELAALRDADVAGLDAAEESLAIARERVPSADFRLGELEDLPWPKDTFDVVTGFNSFQFATDMVNALREARRVARPNGRVAMAVWGREQDCGMATTAAVIFRLLPPPPAGDEGPFALGEPGRIERMMVAAGLEPLSTGEVDCPFVFPDLDTALLALLSPGISVAAGERVGDDRVRQAITESLTQFQTPAGGFHQPNRFRYVIAEA